MMKKILIFWIALLAGFSVVAQTSQAEKAPKKDGKNKGILAHFALGGHLPAGDLSKRFQINGAIGAGTDFITKSNWIVGLEGAFFFGSKINEDPLAIIRTPSGDIIGNDRTIATVRLQQRGMYLGATFGKLITFKESREGLRLTFGGGWTQHRIRILDDARTAAQLTGDYRKGYDRLTGGPAFQQFVGWQRVGYGREVSWLIGLEFNQGFTNTRRDWDFTEMRKLDEPRIDLRFGVRMAFTLPFYTGFAEEIYY
jgi:hypothetical protein